MAQKSRLYSRLVDVAKAVARVAEDQESAMDLIRLAMNEETMRSDGDSAEKVSADEVLDNYREIRARVFNALSVLSGDVNDPPESFEGLMRVADHVAIVRRAMKILRGEEP